MNVHMYMYHIVCPTAIANRGLFNQPGTYVKIARPECFVLCYVINNAVASRVCGGKYLEHDCDILPPGS